MRLEKTMRLIEFLPLLSLVVFISAGLTIIGYYLRPPHRILIYIFKPLATILVFVIAGLPDGFLGDPYAFAICIGLAFSLIGDILLMLPKRRFLTALVSFLITHICYALAFLAGAPAPGFPIILLPSVMIGAGILAYLWPALSAGMKAAVGVYVAVIVIMVSLAAGRAFAFPSIGTVAAALGAILFLASDAVLAVNRFRRPFYWAQAVILGTYFAGQWLIALSIGLRSIN